MHMPDIDFGVQIEPQFGFDYVEVSRIARVAEDRGFESLWVSDHFFLTPRTVNTNALECYVTLSALSRDTKRLRLGAMVASQSYRNPALLADMAASLDQISGGRLYFGIGAGWKEVEYKAYGIPFPRAATRIQQLDEALEICRRMWREPKATYEGRHYRVKEALCMPKPVQDPLPVVVGGTGSMTLRVAARHADMVNFAWSQPPGFFDERYGVLEEHCTRIGRDPPEIRRSAGLMVILRETREELEAKLVEQERMRNTEYIKYLSRQPPNIACTPDVLVEKLEEYVSLGVDHFVIRWPYGDEVESIELFHERVMSEV